MNVRYKNNIVLIKMLHIINAQNQLVVCWFFFEKQMHKWLLGMDDYIILISINFIYSTMQEEMIVTPWEVKGKIDYEKLTKKFGTTIIDQAMRDRLKKSFGELHPFLARGIFYSYRDLDWLLDKYDAGEKFFIYTGRGPSGDVHLGHLLPWIFASYLQKKGNAELYFQFTDDEKYLLKEGNDLEHYRTLAYDNLLDLLAIGFDIDKVHVYVDTVNIKSLYPIALKVSKKINFSTAKAVFGFKNEDNIGKIFYTSLQSVLAFLPSVLQKRNIPCLIPCGIDQDPHFRVTRDVAPSLGFYKPAIIHNKMLPGLTSEGKMSSSDPSSVIYTTDNDKTIEKKIKNAFTGGRATVAEQRRLGADPYICPVFYMYQYIFEPDDRLLADREEICKKGSLLCGDCKNDLIKRVQTYLNDHRKKREIAKKEVDRVLVRD